MRSQKNKLNPKTFRCKRCGECCKLYTIKLTNDDIRKIEKKYNKNYFLSCDEIENYFVLKRINNKCLFLRKKKDKYFCEIYDIRPNICQKYPFFKKDIETCKPVTIGNLKSFLNKT